MTIKKIYHFEVAAKDEENTLPRYELKRYREPTENGWRLPSREELNLIYENKDKIGGLCDGTYWSSTQYECYRNCAQEFSHGMDFTAGGHYWYNIRLIRDVKETEVDYK